MSCFCCLSDEMVAAPLGLKNYLGCCECGFVFLEQSHRERAQNNVIYHHENIDPHWKVAESKQKFFRYALDKLASQVDYSPKAILDVGCNYGYFLKGAFQIGWQTFGVDIATDAVKATRKLIGEKSVFRGTLKEAKFADNFFDAITLWDVLCLVNNPADEITECFRVLKQDGIIGIRLGNLIFQKIAYHAYERFKSGFLRLGIKKPYVFQHFCFTPSSIKKLLARSGFTNINVEISPLTVGDPYQYMKTPHLVSLCKIFTHISAKTLYLVSNGKLLVGSSMLVWAQKPSNDAEN